MDRLLVCVDFTPVTGRVLQHASHLATRLGAEMVLLHVAPADPEWVGWGVGPASVRRAVAGDLRERHRSLQRLADELRPGARVKALTVQGPTPETILAHATSLDADLLVIGGRRRGPVRELVFGSVARKVLRRTTRPVLVVPAQAR